MRKLMMLIAVAVLLVLAGCPKPPDVPEEPNALVNISTVEGFNTTTYMGSLMQKSSMVDGFDHQYDTCYLTVTNQGSTQQTFYKNPDAPEFLGISLSKGLYSFYVDSNEDALLIDFHKAFIAYSQPDSVRSGQTYNLELNEEVDQACVLVDVATVDGTPTITVGQVTIPMRRQGNFWYAYTLGPGSINAVIGGTDVIQGFPFKQGEYYVWSAVKGNITTKDGFTHITYL